MLKISNVSLDAPFFQAGLAGYSDTAMRLIARRHGAPYAVTEAMLDQFLIQGGKGLKNAELDGDDHPIAGQLMGSHPDEIAAGAKILIKLGYDVIDINLACPVKKIRKKSRGGHLLQEPDDAVAVLDAVRQAVGDERPCTVKLRRGTDDSVEALANFHKIFQAVLRLGYAGANVHGRTVEQKYVGPSRWTFLRTLVDEYQLHADRASAFTIMGSGDIWCAADIFKMMHETGVHGVSVARGCIGNPWVFTQARAYLQGDVEGVTRPPTIFQQRAVLLEHFELSRRLHGEYAASMMMRKFGIKFSRHHPLAGEIAAAFIKVKSLSDWHRVLDHYYRDDGPGVMAAMHLEPKPSEAASEETCEVAPVLDE